MRNRDPKLVAAAVLVYSLFALLISAVMAHATPVGMQAQGVDAWTAWHNSGSIDVRDELNRPVSARLIESQVKNTMVQDERQAAFASRLPDAKAAIVWLDRLPLDLYDLRSDVPFLPNRIVEALPWVLRPFDKWILGLVGACLFTLCAGINVLTSGLVFNHRSSCLFVPLRC